MYKGILMKKHAKRFCTVEEGFIGQRRKGIAKVKKKRGIPNDSKKNRERGRVRGCPQKRRKVDPGRTKGSPQKTGAIKKLCHAQRKKKK